MNSVHAQESSAGRARAIRLLLARPLLNRDADDDFGLVVQHARWLQRWFDDKCGWVLVVDARHGFARLRKVPAAPSPHRGARTARSTPRPFTRRRYALLCVVAAVLSDTARSQISLQDLVDRIRVVTSEHEAITEFVPRRDERLALIDAITLLVEFGILEIVEARGDYVDNEAANVLYNIDDRRLGHLIAAPRPPSLATSLEHLLHEDRYGPWTPSPALSSLRAGGEDPGSGISGSDVTGEDESTGHRPALRSAERARALAAAGTPGGSEDQRRRRVRHHIMRILLDDPVLYIERLGPLERNYLQQTIGSIAGWADDAGMVLERRAEGWALVDPDNLATDTRFPEGNNLVKHAALLLVAALQPRWVPSGTVRHPRAVAETVIGDRLRANPTWARGFQDDTGAVRLTAAALDLLPGLDLAAIDPTGVTLLPAAGRYRAEIADVPRAHHGGQPGSDAQPGLFESDNPVSPLRDHSNEGPDDFRN